MFRLFFMGKNTSKSRQPQKKLEKGRESVI